MAALSAWVGSSDCGVVVPVELAEHPVKAQVNTIMGETQVIWVLATVVLFNVDILFVRNSLVNPGLWCNRNRERALTNMVTSGYAAQEGKE